jgi:hypothetical protein
MRPNLFLFDISLQSQLLTVMSETSRTVIGKFKPCKDGVICTLEESLLGSQNPLRDQASFPPPSIRVTVGQPKGHSGSRSLSGQRLMRFPAFFTPMGSSETFKAKMCLHSTLEGSFNGYFYGLGDQAHFFTKGSNILTSVIDETKYGYSAWEKPDRFKESEFDVYDTQRTLNDGGGISERCFQVGDIGLHCGANSKWDISLTESTDDIREYIWAAGTSYTGTMWLSIPGYDPETGTVRTEAAVAETAAPAGAENASQGENDQDWVLVDE